MKNVGTCFCQRQRSKSLVSATFFTERERPTATVMHKKGVSTAYQWHIISRIRKVSSAALHPQALHFLQYLLFGFLSSLTAGCRVCSFNGSFQIRIYS